MAAEITISTDIKEFISDLIQKHNLDKNSEVIYGAGSDIGDGYLSKTLSVKINTKNDSLDLFLKYALTFSEKINNLMPFDKIYQNETYFYDIVYPAYQKFAEKKGLKNALQSVPKCYGTSPKNIIALENLKTQNFEMFNRKKSMNKSHILAILKSLAEYHAISLAFKDQEKEEYKKLTDGILSLLDVMKTMEDMQRKLFNDFFSNLDQVKDKYIIDRTKNLIDKIIYYLQNEFSCQNEFSIITKGDCWSNNMMFLYEDETKETPSKMMLIDWQIIKPGSLVLDLSYVLYTLVYGEELNKISYYLEAYYNELSKYLKELGSDPEIVYPFTAFQTEWKEHCIFGFAMSFNIIKFMLINKDEAPNLEEIDFLEATKEFFQFEAKKEYFERIKKLTQYMIDNEYI